VCNERSLLPLLRYCVIQHLGETERAARVACARRKRVGDITIRELASAADTPNGVYAFFDSESGERCAYIGKASSRSFLGRIPAHCDPRTDAWMNQLTRRLCQNFPFDYDQALQTALDHFVVMVGFPLLQSGDLREFNYRAKLIAEEERMLIQNLRPHLQINGTK
jgi:hypothetical protein